MASQSNPVTWFEIPVIDMNRAREFYERVLEMKLAVQDFGELQMAWFPMTSGSPGTSGTLVKAESYVPSHHGTMVYFEVPDIDAALARVVGNGGKLIRPKTGIGQYGYVGHFEDSEGNRVALHSMS